MCISAYLSVSLCRWRSPGATVIDDHEKPDRRDGNSIQTLWRAKNALNYSPISPVLSFSFEIPIFPYVILFYLYPCFLNLCSAFFLLVLFSFDAYSWLCMICTLKFFYLKFSSYIFWSCAFPSQTHPRSFPNSLLTQLHVLSLLSQKENKKKSVHFYTFKNISYLFDSKFHSNMYFYLR